MGYFLLTDFTITFLALMVKKTLLTPVHRHNSSGRIHISLSDQIKSCLIQTDQRPGHPVLFFHNPSPHIPIPSWPGPVLCAAMASPAENQTRSCPSWLMQVSPGLGVFESAQVWKASSKENQKLCYQCHHEGAQLEHSGLIWKFLLFLRTLSVLSNTGKQTCSSFAPLCNLTNPAASLQCQNHLLTGRGGRILLTLTKSHH